MIRKFSTVYAGHIDLPDMGQHATPAKSNKKKHTKHHRKSAAAKPSALKNSTPNSPAAK